MYETILNENFIIRKYFFRNEPKFLDSKVWANSADTYQTASAGAISRRNKVRI